MVFYSFVLQKLFDLQQVQKEKLISIISLWTLLSEWLCHCFYTTFMV